MWESVCFDVCVIVCSSLTHSLSVCVFVCVRSCVFVCVCASVCMRVCELKSVAPLSMLFIDYGVVAYACAYVYVNSQSAVCIYRKWFCTSNTAIRSIYSDSTWSIRWSEAIQIISVIFFTIAPCSRINDNCPIWLAFTMRHIT